MALLDFEKAYDRVIHQYLRQVLEKFNFGPKFLQALMSTVNLLQSSVCINGWVSLPFSVDSGVRQGDPLAVYLFLLAIEPFAATLRKSITGFPLVLGRAPDKLTFRTRMFADDVAVVLRTKSDAVNLNSAIQLYQHASWARLAAHISILMPLAPAREEGNDRGLEAIRVALPQDIRLSYSSERYLGVQVGLTVDTIASWKGILDKTRLRLARIPMFDLPLRTRCEIVNTYAYSKVVYLDKFIPARKCDLEELEEMALNAMFRERQRTSLDRLYRPLRLGGFGLLEIRRQLDGARGNWARRLFYEPQNSTIQMLRLTIIMVSSARELHGSKTTFSQSQQ